MQLALVAPFYYPRANIRCAAFPLLRSRKQGDNLKEALTREDKPQRKIGFVTSYSK